MRLIIWAIMATCAACGSKDADTPTAGSGSAASGSAASKPVETLELVRCIPAPAPLGVSFGRLGGGGIGTPSGELAPPLDKVAIRIVVRVLGADAALVQQDLENQRPAFQRCYDEVATQKLEGKVVVSFSLDGAGAVTDARAAGFKATLSACIADAVRATAFAAPKDGKAEASARIEFSYVDRDALGLPRRKVAAKGKAKPKTPPKLVTQTIKMTPGLLKSLSALNDKPAFSLPEIWTPFARSSETSTAPPEVTAASTDAVTTKLAAIEQCYASKRGSLRALITVDPNGGVAAVRAGGVGDATLEHCVAGVLKDMTFPTNTGRYELACDFKRGDDVPWRLTTANGYTVVKATQAGVELDGKEIPITAIASTTLAKDQIAAVIASHDAVSASLELAMEIGRDAPITLVAVEDGTNAPVLVGVSPGHDSLFGGGVELASMGSTLELCLRGVVMRATPAISDRAAIAAAIAATRSTWCEKQPCDVQVAVDKRIGARELVAIAAAARTAGVAVVGLVPLKECGW